MVKAVGSGRCDGCAGIRVFLLLTRGASGRGVCIVPVGSPGTSCGREPGDSRQVPAGSGVGGTGILQGVGICTSGSAGGGGLCRGAARGGDGRARGNVWDGEVEVVTSLEVPGTKMRRRLEGRDEYTAPVAVGEARYTQSLDHRGASHLLLFSCYYSL